MSQKGYRKGNTRGRGKPNVKKQDNKTNRGPPKGDRSPANRSPANVAPRSPAVTQISPLRTKSAPPTSNKQDHTPAFIPEKYTPPSQDPKYNKKSPHGSPQRYQQYPGYRGEGGYRNQYPPYNYPAYNTNQYNNNYGFNTQTYPYPDNQPNYPSTYTNPAHTAITTENVIIPKKKKTILKFTNPKTGKALELPSRTTPEGAAVAAATPPFKEAFTIIKNPKPQVTLAPRKSAALEIKRPDEVEAEKNAAKKSSGDTPDKTDDAPKEESKEDAKPKDVSKVESKDAKPKDVSKVESKEDAKPKDVPKNSAEKKGKDASNAGASKKEVKEVVEEKQKDGKKAEQPKKKEQKQKVVESEDPAKKQKDPPATAEVPKTNAGKEEDSKPVDAPAKDDVKKSEAPVEAKKETAAAPAANAADEPTSPSAPEEDWEKDDGKLDDSKKAEGAASFYKDETWSPFNKTKKKKYDRDFLLKFQPFCTDRPATLPSLDMILGGDGGKRGGGGGGRPGWKNSRDRGFRNNNRRGSPYSRKREREREPMPKRTGNEWVRINERREDISQVEKMNQLLTRRLIDSLNKLAEATYDKTSRKVVQLFRKEVKDIPLFRDLIGVIFDKALYEPKYCKWYARLCADLHTAKLEYVSAAANGEKPKKITFKRVLLNKCQQQFEKQKSAAIQKLPAVKRKERVMGNMIFIGQLYKKNLLTDKIMHHYVLVPLLKKDTPFDEDIEALCKLMNTVGRDLDTGKGKQLMDQYFDRMRQLTKNSKVSTRLQCLVIDVLELRQNNWMEKTAAQVRRGKSVAAKSGVSRSRVNAGQTNSRNSNAGTNDGWQKQRRGGKGRDSGRKKKKNRNQQSASTSQTNMFSALAGESSPRGKRNKKHKNTKVESAPKKNTKELTNEAEILWEEYFSGGKVDEFIEGIKNMKAPNFHLELLYLGVNVSFGKKDDDRFKVSSFMINPNNGLKEGTLIDMWKKILGELPLLKSELPKSPNYIGVMLGELLMEKTAVTADFVRSQLESLIESGAAADLVGSLFQTVSEAYQGSIRDDILKDDEIFYFLQEKYRKDIPYIVKWSKKYGLSEYTDAMVNKGGPNYEEEMKEKAKQGTSVQDLANWLNGIPGLADRETFPQALGYCAALVGTDEKAEDKKEATKSFGDLIKKYVSAEKQVAFIDGVVAYCQTEKRFLPRGMMSEFFTHLHELDLISGDSFKEWVKDKRGLPKIHSKSFMNKIS